MKKFKVILTGILVIFAGIIGLYLVNLIGSIILKVAFGNAISPPGVPLNTGSQIVFLIITFIAGFVAAFTIAFLLKQKPWIHLGIFGSLSIIADIFAIQGQYIELPIWVKIILIITVPLQIFLGGKLGAKYNK